MLSEKLQKLAAEFSADVVKTIQDEVLSSVSVLSAVGIPAAITSVVAASVPVPKAEPKRRGRKPKVKTAAPEGEKPKKKIVLSDAARKARGKSLEKARAQKAKNARARKKAEKQAAETKVPKKRGRKPKEAVPVAATNHAKPEGETATPASA